MNTRPKAPPVYQANLIRISAPAVYKPGQAGSLSAQLKPAHQFLLETRPAPPVYRPQQANTPSQPKLPASSAQQQAQYQLSSPIWVGNGRQQIRVTAKGSHMPIGSVDVHYNQPKKAYISDLAVAPAHRRHGVGTMLMKAAMESARRTGSLTTELEARPGPGSISTQSLVGMYTKLGLKQAGVSRRGNPFMKSELPMPVQRAVPEIQRGVPSPGSRGSATRQAGVASAGAMLRSNPGTIQRMQQPQQTGDPSDFMFIHHTVSPYFSSGPTKGSPGEHLDKVVKDIESGNTNPMDFPPLPIFTIDDPNGIYGTQTFSLSNRRLYVFKKSGTTNIKVRAATIQEVLDSLWKMTNESGGYLYPKLTQFGNKNVQPTGLLGEFRIFCQQNQNNPVHITNTYNFR